MKWLLQATLLVLVIVITDSATAKLKILLLTADDYGVESSLLYNSTNSGATLPPTPNLAKHPDGWFYLSEPDQCALVAFLKTLTDEKYSATRR